MNNRKSSIGCALLAMLVATVAFAQAPAPAGEKPADAKAVDGTPVVAKASKRAEAQLAKSVEELNTLRAQIATEKLPIAQQLTGLEENVIQLRAESRSEPSPTPFPGPSRSAASPLNLRCCAAPSLY